MTEHMIQTPDQGGQMASSSPPPIPEALRGAVDRGAGLLDERYGLEWAEVIDLDHLNLADKDHCVLGQLYWAEHERTYDDEYVFWSEITAAVGLTLFGAIEYGFAFDYLSDTDTAYADLTEAWRDEILWREQEGQD